MVHAMESFLNAQITAMRTTCSINPCSFIDPRGLHDERVIIHPLSYRVTEPPGFGIFGEISPVRPNHPPDLAELVQEVQALGRLEDLSRPEFV
jgi:hypothetical protein